MKRSIIAIILASFICVSCATTTGPQVSSAEISAKKSQLKAKADKFKLKQQKRIKVIAQRVISFMPTEDQKKLRIMKYKVDGSPEVNASVKPGQMVVSYGMLRFAESDDELAVVLAHELAHLAKGHYGKTVATSLLATTVGLAAGIAVESAIGVGGGAVASGVAQGIAGGFSRGLEREADYFGFQYAYMAGFDIVEGGKIWERFAIEIPRSMTRSIFATHPSSPERLIRAEKTLAELRAQGILPTAYNRIGSMSPPYTDSGLISQVLSVPAAGIAASAKIVSSVAAAPLNFSDSSQQAKSNNLGEAQSPEGSTEQEQEIMTLKEEIRRMKESQRVQQLENQDVAALQAQQQLEMERVLLEAKESAIDLRYSEFGIKQMGVAKKVTNYAIAQQVKGSQQIFSLSQGHINWFAKYDPLSARSWGSIAKSRRYRAYWYSPNGRLYNQQDFSQSKVSSDFAKTRLEWDFELGDYLIGKWLVRVFQDGILLDERPFHVVKSKK